MSFFPASARSAIASTQRVAIKSAAGARRAAVLVPVVRLDTRAEPHVLFTKRSLGLSNHKGQVSFPGGRADGHETAVETALRETREEVGLDAGSIEVVGQLSDCFAITGEVVTPVVGVVSVPLSLHAQTQVVDFAQRFAPLVISPREVADVMILPFSELLDPRLIEFEDLGQRARRVPVFLAGRYRVWGLTAMILQQCWS